MSPDSTKAARYVQLLDDARCRADWNAVPELVRKVRKHAPGRTCLLIAAESELIVSRSLRLSHPSTPVSNSPDILRLVAPLSDAIQKERGFPEDAYQAEACLGWIYWVLGNNTAATSYPSRNTEQEIVRLNGPMQTSNSWTKVCGIRGAYIRGTALSHTGSLAESLATFRSALPILSSLTSKPDQDAEARKWSELFLTQFCMASSRMHRSTANTQNDADSLFAFRSWGQFWSAQPSGPSTSIGGYNGQAEVSRRSVWLEYYKAISYILQHNLPYPAASMSKTYSDTSERAQQWAELQRVGNHYETLMLKEVNFPRADESRQEVEDWVNIVVENWKILCGSTWHESDLGQGGQGAAGRNVLDILYRAATKTFHSTTILRHLFTVHLALADFDLAFTAFDTYIDIVKKGKARVEKTGEAEVGLDDNEAVLVAASDCMQAMSRYGNLPAAQKAFDLADFFKDWLNKHYSDAHGSGDVRDGDAAISGSVSDGALPAPYIAPLVIAKAWRSIGICHAQLARLTLDHTLRTGLQQEAVAMLRKALSSEYQSSHNVHTLYALAVVLAERRELGRAIECVKSALLKWSSISDQTHLPGGRFARERALMPLWHLLALLLSARQEFVTAARACDGAFEQFKGSDTLFGRSNSDRTLGTDNTNRVENGEIDEKSGISQHGAMDEMTDTEKAGVLQIKMTQLTLIGIMEGPEVAVNACEELLVLFTRLFGDINAVLSRSTTVVQTVASNSRTNTMKSRKGSIFGRSSRSIRGHTTSSHTEKTALASRPHTAQTSGSIIKRTPTIQVTTENGTPSSKASEHHEKLQKRNGSLKKSKSQGSFRRRISLSDPEKTTSDLNTMHSHGHRDLGSGKNGQVGLALSPDQSSPGFSTAYEVKSEASPREYQITPPDMQDSDLQSQSVTSANLSTINQPHVLLNSSSANPVTQLPREQEQRWKSSLLIKVWLLIAGFYRKAGLLEDATGATDEAEKLVKSLEVEVANDLSGTVAIDVAGWGQEKSIMEMAADVYSERGQQSVAEGLPYDALNHFETALVHFSNHPSANIGLSNILLDVYTEALPPAPSGFRLHVTDPSPSSLSTTPDTDTLGTPSSTLGVDRQTTSMASAVPSMPLGLAGTKSVPPTHDTTRHKSVSTLEQPHKISATACLDRLAARDRAFGMLSTLTRLGSGWNNSEAWYTLARAYEEGGQLDKARESLWWCVELEESTPVRDWFSVSSGGYVL